MSRLALDMTRRCRVRCLSGQRLRWGQRNATGIFGAPAVGICPCPSDWAMKGWSPF